jgi:hypothetical protein
MTTYAVPSWTNDVGDSLRWERITHVTRLCRIYLGREPVITDDGSTLSATFTPDLTAGEANTLRRIVRISGFGMMTPDDIAGIEADIDTLTAFVALGNPTNAQAVAAVKSVIRVLNVVFRP